MAVQDPPAIDRNADVHARLKAAYAAMGPDYTPRTHLMDGDSARYVNRLIEEASPYLIQHAHNPVDWHPWNDETLAKAVAEDKPIFLSVGYATCHWCHVMEEESFDNEEVAALLNTYFIPIKVDREQNPDLDHLYITATQLQQGHAGWPNSLWLMPDGRPFHTGTYFPKPHFMQVLTALGQSWTREDRRPDIEKVANGLSDAVRRYTQMRSAQSAALTEETYARAADRLLQMHNALEGGFSQSQQFPQEGYLTYLLDHWRRTGDDGALTMALETLDAIAAGGIHDHVGGGFHRYTVDPNWRTPHFEKMLYNQGQLARAFVEAWEITGSPAYRRAAERTFHYIARDMTDPDGAFYAAEDADSLDGRGELEEGAFYVFMPEQIAALGLGTIAPDIGLDQAPTIEAGAVVHFDPQSAPDFDALEAPLETLRAAREERARPLRDEKIIAGWNGLMIRALADGSVAFAQPIYAEQAARAGDALWNRLWSEERATLARLWAGGRPREAGTLDDYAWLGLGFVALHDATGDQVWEDRAHQLAAAIEAEFADGTGRLRMAAADGPLGPIYDNADGAVPSGESSALELLARLARRSTDLSFEERALALRSALSGALAEQPILRTDALIASRVLDSGESGARQALSKGTVIAHWRGNEIELAIADGWHVNAHEPGQDWLIGAALEGGTAAWPGGKPFSAGFSDERILVYEDTLAVPVADASGTVSLTLQVCSHEICLEPETAVFRLP